MRDERERGEGRYQRRDGDEREQDEGGNRRPWPQPPPIRSREATCAAK